MRARRNYIFTNKYIPPATKTGLKWYEQDLNTWFGEMKYKEATDSPGQYFNDMKFVNFDVIYNDIRKTKLQKPLEQYQTINKNDFDGYDQKLKNEMLGTAHRSKRKDILVEKELDRKHFLEKYPQGI